MNPELRQFTEKCLFCLASVQRVAELLPADDTELDVLLGEMVQENNPKAFLMVVVAALGRARPVPARHLAPGAMLLGHELWLGNVMMKAQGDVPEAVLDAIENTRLSPTCEAVALMVMADWCRDHRAGKLPEQLISIARKLARRGKLPNEAQAYLMTLAFQTNDAGLLAIARSWYAKGAPDKRAAVEKSAQALGEQVLLQCRRPILELVGEKTSNLLAQGSTMRRAVAKTGRNDPCPCGSGKKHKHCCLAKDEERLHHSSVVAGVTVEELRAAPEPHLTPQLLDRLQPADMLKLDPLQIAAALRDTYFLRLCVFHLFDRAAEALEKIGWSDEMLGNWEQVMFFASRAGRKDIIQRIIAVRERPEDPDADVEIPLSAAFLLDADNPAKILKLMDESAKDVLASENLDHLRHLVGELLFSRHRALGILVARGAIPILPSAKASLVFDEILEARDTLNLPPDDPFGDIVDKRYAEHEADDAKLRAARQTLDAKAQEVRELKEKMDRQEQEIARHEQRHAAAQAAALTVPEEASLKAMRQKLAELKTALNDRHHERNNLRRELQKAHTDLDTLRQSAAPAAAAEAEPDHEEELLLPQDAVEVHPVRLIEFPKGFQAALAAFPRHVARAAMIMIGRLAAGEPAAFVGALRLKQVTDVMRQRIGSDYRLFFRLHPDRLQVIDLINRKDFHHRLKTLKTLK
jgi:hypothetical protein